MTGKYTCPECVLTNGWHEIDDGNPEHQPQLVRCPNRAITEQAEQARKLGIQQQTDRDLAARAILEDAAHRFLEFSANNIQDEIRAAQLDNDPGVMGRAFTWAQREGLIANTGRLVKSVKEGTHGKPVAIYRSLLRDGTRAEAS